MGWRQFYKITSDDFRRMFGSQRWGDLDVWGIVFGDQTVYGAGYITVLSRGQAKGGLSPKIQVPVGAQLRITIKFYIYGDAGVSTEYSGGPFIMFFDNGNQLRDPGGNTGFGASLRFITSPPGNTAVQHELRLEYNGSKIVWYLDSNKLDETMINGTPHSFAIWVRVARHAITSESEEPSGTQPQFGVCVHEVTGEFYDALEDIFRMMTQMMLFMMFIMMGIMFFRLFFGAFRSGKAKERGGVQG
jgi:hypothetical protein